ncbi:CHY zinc finger protein [Corynebacterium sp. UMB6689]|uniref:CHY zinc finger protein n=1 Tax=unclassified Corynebacterium TaxID=2624378 RepID=UPI0009F1E39D|nr:MULTISPECIES: CHY zinc finger protein [unclassified Corynebacterium]MDK6813904.1 CHY zinc finger protein [Corynebacterium sp. UMB6689]
MTQIHGAIDAKGRCRHWHTPVDVIANKCHTCGGWFACSLCHAELTDHDFGPMPKDELCVMCGACGRTMTYAEYSAYKCPACGHAFNPGCALHAGTYFL